MGDVTCVRQVLVNLVSNAIKFTPSGAVSLRAEVGTDARAQELRLIVDDTGPGIPEAARERVFDAYVQGDPSINRQHGDTGLGLAICRELVELMGGRIRAQSSPAGGARFVVGLPLRAAELPLGPSTGSSSDSVADSPLSVLLVEDNAVNRLVTEIMLQHAGAHVITADSGEASLVHMRETRFDLVLMDLQMPGMDGLSATRLRRAEEERHGWPRVRILALTGEVRDAARAETDAAGAGRSRLTPLPIETLQGNRRLVAGKLAELDR